MKKILGFIIVLALSYWMVRPLFGPGYFPMHDDTQVARVVEMGRALREGQFPVRWVSDLGYGYGYPIFNFYGPLPYYAGGFFYALGLTGLTATKLMMGLGLVLAGATMYFTVAEIAGVSGGILAAAFYMYAPYHAVDAYVRGAVGEYWALIFVPLIFLGIWRLVHGKATTGLLIGAAGIAGLITSHTILGYTGMIFVAVAALITGIWQAKRRNWQTVRSLIMLVLLGVGLSAFFWLPALSEMKYTNVASQISATADYHDHFVCLPQLWNSAWGYGGSAKGCLDGFSFKVGKEHLVIAFIALLGVVVGIIRERRARRFILAGMGILLLSIFFTLPVSQKIWETLPLFAYVQYPWRFLAFAIFGVSLVTAGVTYLLRQKYVRWGIVVLSIAILLFIEIKRFATQYTYVRPPDSFESAVDIEFRASKISDEYLPAAIPRPVNSTDIVRDTIRSSEDYTLKIVQNTDTYKKFEFLSGMQNQVKVNVAYFPGWTYMVNEFTVKPPLSDGLPILTVPAGLTVVQMRFSDTPMRTAGNVISVICLCLWLYIYDKRKKTIG